MKTITESYRSCLEQGIGLPGESYTSEAIFTEENQRLFQASWLCIGALHDVPEPGDTYPVLYAGVPLLIVRDHDRKVRVFHNVCAHRGAIMSSEPKKCKRSIVCPYHGWSYGLDGELLRTPHVGGAGKHELIGISDADNKIGLTEVGSAIWSGLIFVNLSGTAILFEEFILPIEQRLRKLDKASLRYDRELATTMSFEANWKLVVENFVESYHLPSVHPELEKVNRMREHYQILGGHSYLGQGSHAYNAAAEEGLDGLPLRSDMDSAKYEVFYIYPNLIFGPLANFGFVIIANPQSADLTHERLEFFFYGDEALADDKEPQRRANAEFMKLVNSQDIAICKSVQQGRYSPAFQGGIFALPQEQTSLQFLQMVAANMLVQEGQRLEDLISLPIDDIFHQVP